MSGDDMVRAWKDPDSPMDRSDHPAGEIELEHGGSSAQAAATEYILTLGCCNGLTQDTCGISNGIPGCGFSCLYCGEVPVPEPGQ